MAQLTRAQMAHIDELQRRHKKVVVFLGTNPVVSSKNAIPFLLRAELFFTKYNYEIDAHSIPDAPDDRNWSQELDRRILELRPENPITLYGTQEGFVARYSGNHHCEILETTEDEIEDEEIPEAESLDLVSLRAGMLINQANQFPAVYSAVDIALFRGDYTEVLLARKNYEARFRFPGGFAEPEDRSFEDAALRELGEECGELEVEDLIYLGSETIDDWRYRDTLDSIKTHFYACRLVDGEPQAADDIADVEWFKVGKLHPDKLIPEHRPLLELLNDYLDEVKKD